MRRYWAYLRYVIRHRRYVRQECWCAGLLWRGLVHDLSKDRLDEFIPYVRYFYDSDGSQRQIRDKTGYYKPTDTGDLAFDWAWLLHQKRNPHHWQWWLTPEDDGGMKVFEMPHHYWMEMVCDWRGAGRAQDIKSANGLRDAETRTWYRENRGKIRLGLATRAFVEQELGL